jgi:DNA topoisomerase IB
MLIYLLIYKVCEKEQTQSKIEASAACLLHDAKRREGVESYQRTRKFYLIQLNNIKRGLRPKK